MDTKRGIFVWIVMLLSAVLMMFIPLADAQTSPRTTPHSTPLVNVEWLKMNISRNDIVVIDASFQQLYAAKHIPGAISANVFALGSRDASPAAMEQLVRSWGVSADKTIVLYDEGATFMATSLFFELYHHGFSIADVFILDGGLAKWEAAGGATSMAPTKMPAIGNIVHKGMRESARARLAEFVSASGANGTSVLVEGLDAEYYYGGAKFFDRPGHVPNAIMMPSNDFFNPDKTFKSNSDIRQMLNRLAITSNRSVITYCGGGVAASLSFFAAKFLLGYPDVKLFKGSQREWLRDDRGLPFWTYAQANRIRTAQWVNGWNSDMMRMMDSSRLNIIDVRPADVRARGFIPHSLAIPAVQFKSHLASPQTLADVIGQAGLVQADEVVIVSDGGITPDAALAMLALEKLGHAKVSILVGSFDDWALAGLPTVNALKRDGTTPATPLPPVRVQRYVADAMHLRNAVLVAPDIAKTAKTPASPPRIILVAGKLKSSSRPDGNVIEIPYTDLLDKQGNPKAANDIWNLLAKAGVSRYAEIICVADELGEAAVSYVVLKLMGFPDVKVMRPA